MKTMRLNMPQFESLYILMLCLCLALSTFSGCENASAGQEGPYFMANGKKINIESFEREVNEMLDVSGVPGISVAIIENDSVVFANGYGKRKQGKSVDTYQTSSPWSFSVKDEAIVQQLEKLQGQRVVLRYKEINQSMPWQGDTNYFITKVELNE